MPKVKCQRSNVLESGFTLIELIVVIAIMGLLMGLFTANYAGQRLPRNLRISQNELVTNLRKVQSYTLSSRNVPGGNSAAYYLIKFDTATPTKYYIQAIYNANNPPIQMQQVETINLPQNIRLNNIKISNANITTGCALLAFKLPFGKVIMNDGCTIPSSPTVTSGDDYNKLVSYITNSGGSTTYSDTPMVITLSDDGGTMLKTVTISGTTGVITFQ